MPGSCDPGCQLAGGYISGSAVDLNTCAATSSGKATADFAASNGYTYSLIEPLIRACFTGIYMPDPNSLPYGPVGWDAGGFRGYL
jgi:hypothetical protein